ncbi:MAG: carbohydrate binding family 9 domain-containing protein, partial [Chitinophagales bacterium]|nr:carbohydrate binding family 9 domain-containing protein [Chitinophagales bacterium]
MRNSLSPLFFLVSFLVTGETIFAQDTIQRPSLQSTKITNPPKIDGKLDDGVWKNLPVATLDITWLPEYGKVPTRKTEVKVVYDNTAIYIGAMLYDSVPANINTQLSERDGQSNADNFTVGLDTYDDDLNGYRFIVSAAGVQNDQRISLNSNNDLSWDAVWESEVSITENGWICEIKIPYSAIRFPTTEVQNWGLQFNRSVNKTGEYILWSPVDPKIYGVINQWGSYLGLEKITPPLRLSFSPYINTGNQWTPISYEPVKYESAKILNGGLDVKYGINESFTLDATLIPNFGEVQSDNVILNLSPFEQQFDERRPFFTEGTEIFNQTFSFLGDKLFYSRRIGGTPQFYYDIPYLLNDNEEVISNPYETSLYNATKFSGRTDKNLGIGIFNAVAAQEVAVIKDTISGEEREILTSPLTNYNMVVFEQSLKNNSKVSFTNTNTMRDGLYRDANVSQFLYDITNEKHNWNAWGFGNFSQVFTPVTNVSGEVENENTNGYNYIFGVSQFTGKWNFNASHSMVSKTYDHTDMGIQYGNNIINNFFGFNYNNQEPVKGIFFNYNAWGGFGYNLQAEPLAYQEVNFNLGFNGQFKNFWNAGLNFYSKPLWWYDFYEPRVDGAKYYHAPYAFISMWGGSDYRKDLSISWEISGGESPIKNDPYIGGGQYIAWNLSDKFSLNHSISLSKDHSNFGFVDFYADDIIFGRRNVTT